MTDVAIRVEGLSKAYQIRHSQARSQYRTLREDLVALAQKPLRRGGGQTRETFWALDDVSFEVKHGEALGIIGRNGAGKSTLLKILSRITKPTKGQATVYGRVGSLLEVGTGFHPELTGRENIFLNGAILGMTRRDIQRHFDEIVAFAEIEQFLDTPVKRYSSGMYMRLAFAVAAHLEPEVLVVDEVLAVGDAAFQKKCLGKMGEVASGGRTVLFVSHNMGAVQALCSKAVLLSHGMVTVSDDANVVVSAYLAGMSSSAETDFNHVERTGSGLIRAVRLRYSTPESKSGTVIRGGEPVCLEIDYHASSPPVIGTVTAALGIDNELGERIVTLWSKFTGDTLNIVESDGTLSCHIPRMCLRSGMYHIHIYIDVSGELADYVVNAAQLPVESGLFYKSGFEPTTRQGYVLVDHLWSVHARKSEPANE